MKKYLFLVSVAAVALTACTNESIEYSGGQQQAKEISFLPLSRPSTRAAGSVEYNAVEGVDYPSNYDMKLVAYSVPMSSPSDGVAGNYFGSATPDGGILFKYQYAGGSLNSSENPYYWGGNPAQHWPLAQAAINFLGVSYNGSPASNVVSPQFNAYYASGVTVTLSDNKPAGGKQHDLMYAFGRGTVTQSGNTLIFPPKVDMTFNHALAWVYFRVKAGNSAAAAGISIKDIRLTGANYAGTFTAALNNYNSYDGTLSFDDANTKWTAAGTPSENASPNFSVSYDKDGDGDASNDSKALTTSFVGVGDGLLVVPTSELTSTVSFTSFTVDYYFNGILYHYTYTPTDVEKTLSKGKKYIFDITMTLNEIFVNPSVVDWDVTGNNGQFVDIPSYAIGTDWDYGTISKAAATYKFYITGLTGDAPTVSSTGTPTTFKTGPTLTSGVVTFEVNENATASNRGYKIVVSDGGVGSSGKTSTITFTQAH